MKIKTCLSSITTVIVIGIYSPAPVQAIIGALERFAMVEGRAAAKYVKRPFSRTAARKLSTKLDKDAPRFAKATLDTSFKYMLEDKEVQLSFLRAFTDRDDIVDVKQYPISVPPLKPNKKNGGRRAQRHMDFACRIEDGDIFIAEVQVAREEAWDQRALYYAAGVFSQQLDDGDPWKFLQNVIGINILAHDTRTLPEGDFEKHYVMHDKLHPEQEHWPYLQIRQFELPRVNLDALPNGPKKQWLRVFKDSVKFESVPRDFDPAIQKAISKLDRTRWGGELISKYREEEFDLSRYTSALEDERADGVEEGKRAERQVLIQNLHSSGMSSEAIVSAAGVSLAEVDDALGDASKKQ